MNRKNRTMLSLLLLAIAATKALAQNQSSAAGGAAQNTCFQWIDAKTRQPLPPSETAPIGVTREELTRLQIEHDVHASGASGRNYVLVPCEPPKAFEAPGYHVSVRTETGLYRVFVTSPYGQITLNWPDDLSAGEPFSGSWWIEPAGKTQEERSRNRANLDLLRNSISLNLTLDALRLELSGAGDADSASYLGQFTAANGFPASSPGSVPITLNNPAGSPAITTFIPLHTGEPARPTNFSMPTLAQQGSIFPITGPFHGAVSESDFVKIGGTPVPIIAESPRERVAWNTSNVTGPTTIEVGEGGKTYQCPFHNVKLDLSAGSLNLLRGQTTTLTVKVTGLAGLGQDAPLEMVNHSSNVVSMAGGEQQNLVIHPADLGADGIYTTTRQLTGINRGGFNITATVHWDNTCKADPK